MTESDKSDMREVIRVNGPIARPVPSVVRVQEAIWHLEAAADRLLESGLGYQPLAAELRRFVAALQAAREE